MARYVMIALVAVLALPALAAPTFSERVTGFESALATRVAAIAGLPSRTAAELKEFKALAKAAVVLSMYEDATDNASLRVLGKALGGARKASTDSGVAFGAGGLLNGLFDLADTSRNVANAARGLLVDDTHIGQVTKVIDKASVIIARAGSASDSWGSCAKLIVKGKAGFEKAKALAERLRAEELTAK